MSAAPDLARVDPPLVAILRGLAPEHAAAVGAALVDAGFRIVEVPLNRPGALDAIETLARELSADVLVGAGSVLSAHDVDTVRRAGGRLVVSPHVEPAVIRRAASAGIACMPGIATPTEAFAAVSAGAHALKIFPAEVVGLPGLKALASVLPAGTALWPVGGIDAAAFGRWVTAGASGFGIGGFLYRAGDTAERVAERARACVDAWRACRPQ
jgi:2-dehydro-3-deoxyphosphogalactonate aldolase